MLLTPDGKSAGSTDRIMLLAMWARHLQEESNNGLCHNKLSMIFAGMGKPTFPINEFAAKSGIRYWETLWSNGQEARRFLASHNQTPDTRQKIAEKNAVVDYVNPKGDIGARKEMAGALTRWYKNKIKFKEDHILFTAGGAGALHIIFNVINKNNSNSRIITPFPYYTLYAGANNENKLHPINVMKEKGYRLTAKALSESIQKAEEYKKIDGNNIGAFLFCDPNNPLGSAINKSEWLKMAKILRRYPNIPIILDEAYAEMRLDGKKHTSLLQIAPDLKNQIVLIRSATKALSAAGERMAVLVTFNKDWMNKYVEQNINACGHSPLSSQIIFAEAMDKLDELELSNIIQFYKPQVDYVAKRLTELGASMPDSNYKVNGTFYVMADLSDLLGLKLPKATVRALGKNGYARTDEDVVYSLLFQDRVMIAPLSYFGINPKLGYMRITCSGGDKELEVLMKRLEMRLIEARKIKQEQILKELSKIISDAKKTNSKESNLLEEEKNKILASRNSIGSMAKVLKEENIQLNQLLSKALKIKFTQSNPEELNSAANKIQKAYRFHQARKQMDEYGMREILQWRLFVRKNIKTSIPILDYYFLNMKNEKRAEFLSFFNEQANKGNENQTTETTNARCKENHLRRRHLKCLNN